MFENLRLVVLDYPKLIVRDNKVMKILSDMIQAKQINFERTDSRYIPLGGLDMVSTHFLIYETSDIYDPKPVLSIRNCYEDRAKKHNLKLPYEEYVPHLSLKQQKRHAKFRRGKNCIVDCNAWFVDSGFSKSNSGLALSDIAYFMLTSHILKRGFSHFIGTTNEKYKASRWIQPVGEFPKDIMYKHPTVDEDHMIILCEPFNFQWYMECWEKYKELYANRIEYSPGKELSGEDLLSDDELFQLAQKNLNDSDGGAGEVNSIPTKPVAS